MAWSDSRDRARQGKKLSPALRRKIIVRDRPRGCWFKYPGCTNWRGKIEVHHLVEVADGGGDDEENLVACCKTCHQRYSAQQSQRRAVAAAWDWRRKPERHPGVLDDDEL